MKKKKIVLGLLVIIILEFSIISSRGRSRTIEGALNLESNNIQIMHEEKTSKGVIVFRINNDKENNRKGFFTAFSNGNIFGYKDL